MLAVEWGTGQVLWTIVWFSMFILWIWLVFTVFTDIVRARSMSGFTKAIWTMAIIFLPYLGVFLYLIVNGSKMSERAARAASDNQAMAQSYIREVTVRSSADELTTLASLHDAGKLTDDEFAAAKATVSAER